MIADRLVPYSPRSAQDSRARAEEPGDAELVAAAILDPAIFGALYERYGARIYAFVRARIDQPEDAADITQRIFLEALRDMGQLRRSGDRFRAWLFTIARHRIADYYRERSRLEVHLRSQQSQKLSQWAGHTVEDDLVRRDDLCRLHRLVRELEPKKQELIALRYVAGLSAREIGKVTGKSEPAIRQQLSRIVRGLKERYDDTRE